MTAVGVGCGSSVDPENTGGSGGTDSATSTTTSTTGTPGTGGAGGTGGGASACGSDKDKNCDFDTAETIEVTSDPMAPADAAEGDLEPVDEDEDFWAFDGKEGQALLIYTDAKPMNNEFDNTYPDLVITLYNENKEQIAENDDPSPRLSNDSEIYTILPKTGKYYIRVEECSTWAKQNGLPDTSCSAAGDITETAYSMNILELDPAYTFVVAEPKDADITEDKPTAMKYAAGQAAGTFIITTIDGYFTDANDKDYYKFTLPAVTVDATERLVGYFSLLPTGKQGNGSTTPYGKVSIVDPLVYAADKTMSVAQIDGGSSTDLAPPLEKGKEYLLIVDAPQMGGDFAGNPFYFVQHYGGGSNPVEKEVAVGGNDTSATAEEITKAAMQDSFFIEGNLTGAPADKDFFKITIPAGMTKVSVACGAARSGSGLEGFKASLLKTDGMAEIVSASETAAKDLFIQDAAVPSGETTMFLRLEATGHNAKVSSEFYRCGAHFAKE